MRSSGNEYDRVLKIRLNATGKQNVLTIRIVKLLTLTREATSERGDFQFFWPRRRRLAVPY